MGSFAQKGLYCFPLVEKGSDMKEQEYVVLYPGEKERAIIVKADSLMISDDWATISLFKDKRRIAAFSFAHIIGILPRNAFEVLP